LLAGVPTPPRAVVRQLIQNQSKKHLVVPWVYVRNVTL